MLDADLVEQPEVGSLKKIVILIERENPPDPVRIVAGFLMSEASKY